MLRLFLSLYFAICLGLVIINYASSFLYQHLQDQFYTDKDNELNNLSQLASAFSQLSLSQIQDSIPYDAQLIEAEDMSLQPEQTSAIDSGSVISLFDNQQNLNLYVKHQQQQLLKIGPIKLSNSSAELANGIIIFSYLILAVFVLIWSRILWRDLTTLKVMAEQVKQGQFTPNTLIKKQSVIYPIVSSFNLMASKIEQLISSQKQMTQAISHDIKTPLARLKFSLAILNSQPQLITKTTDEMLQDVEEIDQLTSELLTYARLENKQVLKIEQVDLQQLMHNTADKLSRNSDLTLDINCNQANAFYCDGHLIERCLQNLITNGFKYAKSKVKVTLITQNKQLTLTVEDDGEGIQAKHHKAVLNPFNRVDNNTSKSGFGLGLAIVNKIVIWHSGQLQISSSSMGGALITITIPDHRYYPSNKM